MRLGRQVGIHTQRNIGDAPHRLRDVSNGNQLSLALDVKEKNAVLERHANLGVGLAGAGEDDFGSDATRLEGAIEFAAARDVAARASLDHETSDMQIAIGLDAVADQRIDGGKRRLQLLQMMRQRFLAVHVERRAIFFSKRRHGDVVAVKDAIAIAKVVHGVLWLGNRNVCLIYCNAHLFSRNAEGVLPAHAFGVAAKPTAIRW